MRNKFVLLVGVLAVAMASVAPAAQAGTVTFKDESGNPLKVGTQITATSTYFTLFQSIGTLRCTGAPMVLTTTLPENGTEGVYFYPISQVGKIDCYYPGSGALYISNYEGEFFVEPGGVGYMEIGFDLSYWNCHYTGSFSSDWGPENPSSHFGLGWAPVVGTGGGVCGNNRIEAEWELTANGKPITISST